MNENIHYNLKTVKSIYPYSHYQSENVESYTLEVLYYFTSPLSIPFLFPTC